MSSENYTVLYLSRGGDISGAQRQLLYLLGGLDRTRFTPVVLCTEGGQFPRALQEMGVRCILRKLAGWRRVRHLFARGGDVAYVSRLVKDEGVSLVHSSEVRLSEYMLRSAESACVPCILHIRAPIDRRTANHYRCSRATALVPISKRVEVRLSAIAGMPREKIVLIHDAVDPDLFRPKEEALHQRVLRTPHAVGDKVLVGIVGRVEKAKEQLGFVQIAREVLDRTNKAVFFIIGEMRDRSYCRQIIRYVERHGLSNRVHFTGRREDIGDVLADLDILVSLSGGSVRYEAMMCGITVVCAWSRRPEESYHIRHKETGFLVTARKVEPVAHVLLEAIEHDDLRQRIGRNARQWAQQHLSHSMLVESTQDLYDRLLAKRAAPAALVAQRRCDGVRDKIRTEEAVS